MVWGSNIDMSLLIDRTSVTQHIAKYCNKVEAPSQALNSIINQALRLQQETLQENPRSVFRRAFNRLVGRRDKCIMEIAHLILSSSYVECDHNFVTVNLLSNLREVNTSSEADSDVATNPNLVDMYSNRLMAVYWNDGSFFVGNQN